MSIFFSHKTHNFVHKGLAGFLGEGRGVMEGRGRKGEETRRIEDTVSPELLITCWYNCTLAASSLVTELSDASSFVISVMHSAELDNF